MIQEQRCPPTTCTVLTAERSAAGTAGDTTIAAFPRHLSRCDVPAWNVDTPQAGHMCAGAHRCCSRHSAERMPGFCWTRGSGRARHAARLTPPGGCADSATRSGQWPGAACDAAVGGRLPDLSATRPRCGGRPLLQVCSNHLLRLDLNLHGGAALVPLRHSRPRSADDSRVMQHATARTTVLTSVRIHRQVAGQLAALRRAPALQPRDAAFGPAALCLRCALDDAIDRLPPPPPQAPEQQTNAAAAAGAAGLHGEELARQLAQADGLLDGCFMRLCCPPLQSCRAALQVRSDLCQPPSPPDTAWRLCSECPISACQPGTSFAVCISLCLAGFDCHSLAHRSLYFRLKGGAA